ncbi:MAG: FAD-binding protein [FCB group bacterium]|nr:FAD-binding protein [FCB group bacterium]
MKSYDVIIVGAGMAGLRSAIGCVKHDLRTALITKVHPLRSHSVGASGGINAVLDNRIFRMENNTVLRDSQELHFNDTLECGYHFSDADAVETLVSRAPVMIRELERWGCLFSREEDGSFALRRMSGGRFARTLYASDKTGRAIMNTLYEQCVRLRQNKPDQLRIFEEWIVLKLLVLNNTVAGVVAMDIASGKLETIYAKTVIWATGGSGRIYGRTSNPGTNSGWGMAIPYYAGASLKDMEFVQFHPTQAWDSKILISEAARGEGGILINRKEERFLAVYEDSRTEKEFSGQDVISRNIRREILAGRGVEAKYVYLDLRNIKEKKIQERMPGVRELCKTFLDIDPQKELIPVAPGQHYTIGGVHTNENTETDINGFFAAGECACAGVHGANRMGGNSLMETLVFADRAAEYAARYIQRKNTKIPKEIFFEQALSREEERIRDLLSAKGDIHVSEIRKRLNETMDTYAGIFRDGMGLVEAAKTIKELMQLYHSRLEVYGDSARANFGLIEALELRGSLDIADIIVQTALKRNESIGVHFRNDFPAAPNRLRHSLCKLRKGKPFIRHIPVRSKTKPVKPLHVLAPWIRK